jgi:glutamyl-tRNA synthetase/glutamyl-Q tRNA(Asp) synthetase
VPRDSIRVPISRAWLAARLPPRPLTRFAPSPTGYLHLGHVVNAIYVWGLARALDGRVLVRIEDHDRERSRPAFERALLDDLHWLGFAADGGSSAESSSGRSSRQSDVPHVYAAAAERLIARGLVYACGCSRKDISDASMDGSAAEIRYPGTCRARGLHVGPAVGWRVRLEPGEESFEDALAGPQVQMPAEQCGDVLIRDRLGNWTYQFAVVVDDMRQGIDFVIRGRDLLESTGRQLRLARLLGRSELPMFAHHPLVLKAGGEKLSKANRDTGIRELRAAGRSPAEVLGLAAEAGGLTASSEPLKISDLPELFAR